jgi:hypothetical protein
LKKIKKQNKKTTLGKKRKKKHAKPKEIEGIKKIWGKKRKINKRKKDKIKKIKIKKKQQK